VRRVAYAARIKAQLADFTRRVASRDIVESRALGYAALASLAVEDGSLAAGCLRRVLAAQVTDPRSPEKGSIPWNVGPSKAEDFNATEFAVQSWGPILLLYGDRLPPTVRAELIAHARAAVTAVERHVVDLSYDNIALLRAMNLVLLGTAVGDMAARTQGLQALQRFLDWRDQYGIHEFASPTCYGVDLDVLMVSYIALPRDGEVRGLLARALDHYWSDIAAQWDDRAGRLAGAHSRDYDFLQGHGGLDNYMYLEGRSAKPFGTGPGYILAYVGTGRGGYEAHQLDDDHLVPRRRAVIARYGEHKAQTRYTWFEPGISLGTASFDYNYHDKLVNVAFDDPASLSEITIQPEPVGTLPYGQGSRTTASGETHASHAPLYPAIVQREGAALILLDLNASGVSRGFETNIVLPVASIAVDERAVELAPGNNVALTTTNVVTVQHQNAVVALRVFHADRCDGAMPSIALRAEPEGLQRGAVRLVVVNTAGQGGRRCEAVRVGLILRVGSTSSIAQLRADLHSADIEDLRMQASDGWKWRVTAAFANHRFGADEDIDQHFVLRRTVDDRPLPDPVFAVEASGSQ